MKPLHFLLGLLLFGFCLNSLRAEDAPKPKIEMRMYDVRDLTTQFVDHPAPLVALHDIQSSPSNAANPFFVAPAPENATISTIAETIRNRVAPEAWDAALGTSIEERFGQLIVMQTPDKHALIQQLLNMLRLYSKSHVVVKGKLIASPGVPLPSQFTPEALAEWTDAKRGNLVMASPRLICGNSQIVHVLSGKQFSFVHDLDVSGSGMDPIMGTALEGYVFEVCPTMSNDRSSIALDLKFCMGSQAERKEVRGVSYASPVAAPLGQEKALPEMRANLETPSMGTIQLHTQVVITSGKWLLAGVMRNPNPEAKERNLLLFVTAEAAEKTPVGKAMTLGMVLPAAEAVALPVAEKPGTTPTPAEKF